MVPGGCAEGLDQGFRVVINDGRHGSQSVYHLVPFPRPWLFRSLSWITLLLCSDPCSTAGRSLTCSMCVGASTCTSWAAASLAGHLGDYLHGGSILHVTVDVVLGLMTECL